MGTGRHENTGKRYGTASLHHPGRRRGEKSDLTDRIQKLAHIHTEQPEFHSGRYQQLFLTNRQYAFARHAAGSICITAANSDDQESSLSIPVPIRASQAENLMDGSIIPIENGKLNLTLPGNSSVVLKIRED